MFDKDNSGYISKDEIRAVLSQGAAQLDDAQVDVILSQVDDNSDGEISFEEFVSMMKKLAM
jgi:Ca2+-binding EF-hand superfamily protein